MARGVEFWLSIVGAYYINEHTYVYIYIYTSILICMELRVVCIYQMYMYNIGSIICKSMFFRDQRVCLPNAMGLSAKMGLGSAIDGWKLPMEPGATQRMVEAMGACGACCPPGISAVLSDLFLASTVVGAWGRIPCSRFLVEFTSR